MKRFTDTAKWTDPWFRRLEPKLKCLWQLLCDSCDHAGVLDFDPEYASLIIGAKIEESDLASMGDRIKKLPSGKVLILGFIPFQFGQLTDRCRPHRVVFEALARHGLEYPINRVSIGYQYPTRQRQGQGHIEGVQGETVVPPAAPHGKGWFPESFRNEEFRRLWADWEDHCRERNMPLSAGARRAQLCECERVGPERSAAVIRASIERNAKGVLYWDFDTRNGGGGPSNGGKKYRGPNI